jgi:hypothetical protein
LFDDYKTEETKFHHNNIQNEIYDAFLKRIGNEAKFLNTPDKRLSNEFKSYSDFFNAKVNTLFLILIIFIVETTRKHYEGP